MKLRELLETGAERGASDIFVISGLPLALKVNGQIRRFTDDSMMPDRTRELIGEIYELAERAQTKLEATGDDDFSFSVPGVARYRASVYKQRGSLAAVVRVVAFSLPDPVEFGIPEQVLEMGLLTKGLVLITGPAGSGKSTTLACMIDRINHVRNAHVITLEDPIEFLHRHNTSIISQRELDSDTASYGVALRAALRQAPDVILLGEMRDHDTMSVAMTAAETGHLVISTLHTIGAANTVDRIIDTFEPSQQHQIRVQLAMVLRAVVSQQLVPTLDGGLVPAFEIMLCNNAVRNMIRESKIHQLNATIASSAAEGMIAMDASLLQLAAAGRIAPHEALNAAISPETLEKKLDALS